MSVALEEETELVLFEVLRERGRTWVRARHQDGARTEWNLIKDWSEGIRADLLGQIKRVRAAAL